MSTPLPGYLLNTVTSVNTPSGPLVMEAGKLVSDSATLAAVQGGGGQVWPAADPVVAAAAANVTKMRLRGMNEEELSRVMIAAAAASLGVASPANKARGLVTSIGTYTGSGTGTLTASANGAIGAQDGLTLAAGDVVMVPAGILHVTALDSGPYVVVNPGAAAAKFILSRPAWWAHGGPAVQGQTIHLGGEGTNWKGSEWKAMCAKAKVIGTDDPMFYPARYRQTVTLAAGTYTIGAGGGAEKLFLFDLVLSTVHLTMNTGAGTLGTNRLSAPAASRVAGYPGTAAIVVNSLDDAGTVSGADTSTVDVLVTNW